MKDVVNFFSEKDVRSLVNKRAGETKLGQVISVLENWESLASSKAKYILVGIPEDIGVRANHGKPGTADAWKEGLTAFCNIQQNQYLNVESIAVLGSIDCTAEMAEASKITDVSELGKLVSKIDEKVVAVVSKIVSAGKIPVLIGGGHNNSYGAIKGTLQGLGKPINTINLDAHTDFRALEHRHSGNGFSYAMEEGYLDRYFIFGLHCNYTSEGVFRNMEVVHEKVKFNFFEDISVTKQKPFIEALKEAETHCCATNFGIELDMDSIANMGSSAMTPSGCTVEEARRFLAYFSATNNCSYIHICEGSPKAALFPNQVGKTIAYLLSDVIAKP